MIWDLLRSLEKKIIIEILPKRVIEQIHEEARKIALQKSDLDSYNHFSILYPAIKLGWQDVIHFLSQNYDFLYFLQEHIVYFGGSGSLCDTMILEWSLSSKKQLTQQLV